MLKPLGCSVAFHFTCSRYMDFVNKCGKFNEISYAYGAIDGQSSQYIDSIHIAWGWWHWNATWAYGVRKWSFGHQQHCSSFATQAQVLRYDLLLPFIFSCKLPKENFFYQTYVCLIQFYFCSGIWPAKVWNSFSLTKGIASVLVKYCSVVSFSKRKFIVWCQVCQTN